MSASLSSSNSGVIEDIVVGDSARGAPKRPNPPAWASMIDTATGVPSFNPNSSAAALVNPFPIASLYMRISLIYL